ncbi:hypothetical protein CEE37_08000 [candidate division LCP-89 bacterium B3_LCP]|uniref:RNA-binding protein n=1 Tax=candidate division LCP-89 bacterium B3_LCP TaxID=2012998 RepID=A0A532UZF0_UNCL8|nr:MAG: hypothetical protein CEE37_08000 [candidate division LCP-89 bacterium B3_LCP]
MPVNRKYLIDGYNLLYKAPFLTDNDSDNFEEQRERLIRKLVGLSADRNIGLHLIFDTSCHINGRSNYPGIRVNYAKPSADAFIRGEISKNQNNKNLVVVSSDRKDIGNYAKTCGVEWITSEEFWNWLNKRPKGIISASLNFEKTGTAPPGWSEDDDNWLQRAFSKKSDKKDRC